MSRPTETNLRRFKDLDDLFDNVDSTQIWIWVNELYHKVQQTRELGKRYRTKQQEFVRIARERLDPDEIARLEAFARAKAEGLE